MSVVDVVIVALIAGAAVLGWRRGALVAGVAVASALTCGGIAAAVVAAIGATPPAFGLLVGGLLGLVPVAAKLEAITEFVDANVTGAARYVDRAGGMAMNVGFVLVLGWFFAAVVSVLPGDDGPLDAVRTSRVLDQLVVGVPPEGALGTIVLRSGLVPGLNGPLVLAEDADPAVSALPGVQRAAASVFEIRAEGCRRSTTGAAWVVGAGLLATNAHVVAGGLAFEISRGFRSDGPVPAAPGRVVAFDARNDVAIIDIGPTLDVAVLGVATTIAHGQSAAAIGFPRGGPLQISPARIDRIAEFEVEPVGGGAPGPVPVLAFRGDVASGNSGGPIVRDDGLVVGMVVAKAVGQRKPAGYGVPAGLVASLAGTADRQSAPVSTGACIEELGPGKAG